MKLTWDKVRNSSKEVYDYTAEGDQHDYLIVRQSYGWELFSSLRTETSMKRHASRGMRLDDVKTLAQQLEDARTHTTEEN